MLNGLHCFEISWNFSNFVRMYGETWQIIYWVMLIKFRKKTHLAENPEIKMFTEFQYQFLPNDTKNITVKKRVNRVGLWYSRERPFRSLGNQPLGAKQTAPPGVAFAKGSRSSAAVAAKRLLRPGSLRGAPGGGGLGLRSEVNNFE